jgi:hypothetical protein
MVNKTVGIDEEKLKDLSADIPVMTMEQAQSHTEFILSEIEQILKIYQSDL